MWLACGEREDAGSVSHTEGGAWRRRQRQRREKTCCPTGGTRSINQTEPVKETTRTEAPTRPERRSHNFGLMILQYDGRKRRKKPRAWSQRCRFYL